MGAIIGRLVGEIFNKRDLSVRSGALGQYGRLVSPQMALVAMPDLWRQRVWNTCTDSGQHLWNVTEAAAAMPDVTAAIVNSPWMMTDMSSIVPAESGEDFNLALYNRKWLDMWADVQEIKTLPHERRDVQRQPALKAALQGVTAEVARAVEAVEGVQTVGIAEQTMVLAQANGTKYETEQYLREVLDILPGIYGLRMPSGVSDLTVTCPVGVGMDS